MALGLTSLGSSFAWIGVSAAFESYRLIALQMVLMGLGLGLTSTAATESIMGVVRPEQAGAGSAVNDATREIGGTLGVAILGSVYSTLYLHHISASLHAPASAVRQAASSFGAGQVAAARLAGPGGAAMEQVVRSAFMSGLHAACLVAAGVCAVGALAVARFLPSRPGAAEAASLRAADQPQPQPAPA